MINTKRFHEFAESTSTVKFLRDNFVVRNGDSKIADNIRREGGMQMSGGGGRVGELGLHNRAGDRSYRTGSDTEGAATTDNPTTPFPTPPPTLTPNHRQASPFPLESTNSRRHHYNGSVSSDRSRNGNGETVYAAPSKKTNTGGGGTLGRRTRRGHASALSSSSTASDRSETVFPDEHSRIHLGNDTGRDSPPEPAPPEVPPRGPSLHATHTLRSQQTRNGCPPNATANFPVTTDQIPSETYSGSSEFYGTHCTGISAVHGSLCLHVNLL
ncbi:hypothetical protein KPH14_003910 [Odynerus spinipes]|uniref:Uncharacterized protein n=1 Tax=Odynerus spinipes TaxID=1348599 RepID=A0AAD9VUU7_9HYME|nr:hypothetical protein KPH14_003910 [Odynerus spinipes]